MKKFLFLTLFFCAIISTASYAQAGDPPSVLQQMKEKQTPGLVEKVGLTEAQAHKIIEINFEVRQSAGDLRNMSEADRAAKIAEMKATRDKKWAEVLNADQIKALKAYYEDMAKNAPKKD